MEGRLLAFAVVPPLTGLLALLGHWSGLYEAAVGFALTAGIDAAVVAGVATAYASRRQRSEADCLTERALREKLEQLGKATVAISGAIMRSPQVVLSSRMQLRADVNLQAIMQAIVDQAVIVTDAAFGALGIGTNPDEPFQPWAYTGMSEEAAARIGRHPRPVGTLGAVAINGQTIRTADISHHPDFRGLPAHHPPIRSLLAVPVEYQGKHVGNLYLGNKRNGREFTIEDQRAIELLVPHAAVALQQAKLQAVIKTQRARIDSVLAAAPNGIMLVELELETLAANDMALQMLGIDPDTPWRQALAMIHRPDGTAACPDTWPSSRALRGDTVVSEEWLIVRNDGQQIPVFVSAAPVHGKDDGIEGAVLIIQDVSAWKGLERLREEYVSLISHDLRSPLNMIALQAAALRNSSDPSAVIRSEGIRANVRRLTAMINDLVETSRLEAGQDTIRAVPVDLGATLRQLVQTGLGEADRSHISFDLPDHLPRVALDTARFERVMLNLISNSRKYANGDWHVTITAHAADGMVEVTVSDQGPGFPPGDLPHLFDKYYRGARHREYDGLGLGLYISRLIVDALGGRIAAENRPEGGAAVRLWLPIAADTSQQAA